MYYGSPPNETNASFAIATTIADATNSIEIFVRYHISIGAEKIFIFLDDNCQETAQRLSRYASVLTFYKNQQLKDSWRLVPVHEKALFERDEDKEVMQRQCLNLGVASAYARHFDIDWLIHIDSDELFYPNQTDLNTFFTNLKNKNIGSCRFLNYEAIASKDTDKPYFRSCQYFKKNLTTFYGHAQCRQNSTQEQLDYFRETPWLQDKFFNFYTNGKSATNLNDEFTILCVHGTLPNNRRIHYASKNEPIVLHYPCATIKEYVRKYQRLGDFIEYWYSDPIHIKSKELIAKKSNDVIKSYFHNYFALDEDKIKELVAKDLVTTFSELMTSLDSLATYSDEIQSSPSQQFKHKPEFTHATTIQLSKVDVASDSYFTFSSEAKANRWKRRVENKTSIRYKIIQKTNLDNMTTYDVITNDLKCLSIDSQQNVNEIASAILRHSTNANTVSISGLDCLSALAFEQATATKIRILKYQAIGKLCCFLKAARAELCIILDCSDNQDQQINPLIIPLLDWGYVDYVQGLNGIVQTEHPRFI